MPDKIIYYIPMDVNRKTIKTLSMKYKSVTKQKIVSVITNLQLNLKCPLKRLVRALCASGELVPASRSLVHLADSDRHLTTN